MRHLFYILSISILGILSCKSASCNKEKKITDEQLHALADSLAHAYIIFDVHVDIPYRLSNYFEDISVRTKNGHFDYVRAKEGGLDAPMMSIYIPSDREDNGAKMLADSLIDFVAFGSDFDGVERLPKDVSDVSQVPNVIYELLKRDYSTEDIEKICYKNSFRVWQKVEYYSQSQN